MIHFRDIISRYRERPFIIEAGSPILFSEFHERVEAIGRELEEQGNAGTPQVLALSWTMASLSRLFAHWKVGRSVILAPDAPEADLSPFQDLAPLLILRTGGTTGRPRHVVHSLERFLARYAPQTRPPCRLLPLYAPDHVAGLDALLQAFHRGSTLVLPDSRTAPAIVRAMERDKVEVLPATPTFLQFLLLSGALDGADVSSVRIIPHGAEPMPEALRKRLQAAFPNARLKQRFGLTELGALPVEEDPQDPSVLLLKPETGFSWRIEDGELCILSSSRMLGTLEEGRLADDGQWYRTGDLAETTPGGGLRILGRREFLINVGGMKVVPEKVESLLLSQPGVRDAVVYGVPNPLTGEAVCAEVVYDGEQDHMALLGALRREARRMELPLAYVPTRVVSVDAIPRTTFGKRRRERGKT